ncbi:MAG TPA: ABC-F family ATP-binding cassette domain-containing protein [Polyangiaceae bacterium]|nr:ABC-F family ATP-binding cassette domain-containing protein [Polyangiaceae bacterium]
MSVLSARDLVKAYGPQTLFSGASITIEAGERVGLLGANGTGKSTLLRVLARGEPADEGVIDWQRGASILYLPQEPKLPEEASPRVIVGQALSDWHAALARHGEVTAAIERGEGDDDALAEQARLADSVERLGGWEQGHRIVEMLERLGIRDVDRPVGSMSGGEQRRVALASILIARPELMILDEPTNHLDVDTIEFVESYLAERFEGAVLIVTHDRYVLDAIADRVVELDRGVLTEFSGGYSDYLALKSEALAHEQRTEQNRVNRLRRERAWLLRGAKARTTKQKARIDRARALMAIEAPKEAARTELAGLESGAQRLGKTILDLADVSVELGGRTLIEGLTLQMVTGDRIGIVGPNGAGKTTLLRLVSGDFSPARGKVTLGVNTRIAYFDQARANLELDWSVFDNVAEREGAERTGGGQVHIGTETMDLRVYLERFLFDGSKQRQKVSALSGGERARVALAKTLRSGANLLLLDEPTNDLDVATLGELEDLLVSWPGCAIVVSHDRYFLNGVATSILSFEGEGRVVRYPGGYDSYRTLRDEAVSLAAPKQQKAAPKPAPGAAPAVTPPKKLTHAERIELEGILDRVAEAESRVARLEAALSDPNVYEKGAEAMKQLHRDYDAAAADVTRLLARWEALESRR